MASTGPDQTRRHNRKRLAGTAGCVVAAAGVAAHAAATGFTGSTPVNEGQVKAGDLFLSTPSGNTSGNRLTLAVNDLIPNVSRVRVVNVTNAGNLNLASMTLVANATTSSTLNTDVQGLYLIAQACTTAGAGTAGLAWTESGTSPDYQYSCSGTIVGVLNSGASFQLAPNAGVNATNTFANMDLTAGHTNYLRFSFKLGPNAPASLQGQTSVISFMFDGTQRAGANQ